MATLDQVFQQEKAWIAACGDADALLEKIGDYRDDLRVAERDGNMLMRMRPGDLIDLARARVVKLNEREMRAAEMAKTKPPGEMPPAPRAAPSQPVVQPVREPSRSREADDGEQRRAREAVALAAAEKAKADARVTAAEAAKIELQNELLRAQIEGAKRAVVAPVGASAPKPVGAAPAGHHGQATRGAGPVSAGSASITKPAAPRPPPAARPVAPSKRPPVKDGVISGYNDEDRLALASVGRWPPTPPERRGPFWSRDDDWPGEWTLTGGELGRFRGEINLTRAVLATQLGVPSSAIKDAEMKPREKLGPAMQIAVRRAMELERARRQEQREERRVRAEAAARPAPTVEVLDWEVAPSPPVALGARAAEMAPATPTPTAFTGADLARLRAERGLTQKEMADLLGVEQGTISKGEGKAKAPLGPALQEAMARLGAGAEAGGTPRTPE